MITAPNEEGRPMFSANEIVPFYTVNGPQIFPHHNWLKKMYHMLISGPFYDGKELHTLLENMLKNTLLPHTLTNVVIPTFDIHDLQTTIFSTYQVKDKAMMNSKLSDICIGTSAAPTFLPAHWFPVQDAETGEVLKEYNLIDGGVAANNPSLAAISAVMKEVHEKNPAFRDDMHPLDYKRYLVISVGTGNKLNDKKFSAKEVAKWSVRDWIMKTSSFTDIYATASSDMVDYHQSVVFGVLEESQNYLRIQEEQLQGDLASLDIATEENLEALAKVGEKLLNETSSWVDPEEPGVKFTNEQALKKFAIKISKEMETRAERSGINW